MRARTAARWILAVRILIPLVVLQICALIEIIQAGDGEFRFVSPGLIGLSTLGNEAMIVQAVASTLSSWVAAAMIFGVGAGWLDLRTRTTIGWIGVVGWIGIAFL